MESHDQTPAEQTDAQLVRAAQRGDRAAFVEIVARHQALVCGTAYGILNDFAASEDAGQEAFLNAWRKIGDLREAEKLRPWLVRIARNAALGKLRGQRDGASLDEIAEAVDAAPLPDELAASGEEIALVNAHLAKLPEKYRVPLVLFYTEGRSVRAVAVAEALEISENAVKKRLERGREQLRDRVIGLIESTLERTAPNAIFTMAVATAVGALKAPAALAAGVFAGSTATTATASSSGSFFTAMTASQIPYVAAAIVAAVCLPIGYSAHRSLEKDELEPERRAARLVIPRAEPRDAIAAWPDSDLLAEWKRLHDKHGTGAEAMPLIYEEIMRMPVARRVPVADPFGTAPAVVKSASYSPREDLWQKALLSALVAEWAQVDPGGGFDLMRKKMHTITMGRILSEWIKTDLDGAIDRLVAFPPKRGMLLSGAQLAEIARARPGRLVEVVSFMRGNGGREDNNVRDAFSIFAGRTGVDRALVAIDGFESGHRQKALEGILQVWGQQDAAAAMAYVGELPAGEQRDELMRNLMIGQARVSLAAALEHIDEIPPGSGASRPSNISKPGSTGGRVLQAAAEADFEGTIAWLVAHPDSAVQTHLNVLGVEVNKRLNEDTDQFLDARLADGSLEMIAPAIARALSYYESGKERDIVDWLSRQGAAPGLGELRATMLERIARADPMAAIEMARELGEGQLPANRVNGIASSIVGYKSIENFDEIFAATPDFLREGVLQYAFHRLDVDSPRSIHDLEKLAARMELLPVDDRDTVVRDLTRIWVTADAQSAGQWVANLEEDYDRWVGRNTLIESWGAQDPLAASEWVAELPDGQYRDAAAKELAETIVDELPLEAWQWAMSVADEKGRVRALGVMVSRINGGFHREEVDLRGWIESADIDGAAKERLLKILGEELN